MHRFYLGEGILDGQLVHIAGSDVNHIKNVLRMRPGENIVICDGQGMDYYCIIEKINDREIIAKIREINKTGVELPVKLVLFQGLPKKDKMELIIQKAVELGVYKIIPVLTKRTIVKLEDEKKEQKKRERWQLIAESAAKQSGRGVIPEIAKPVSFREALDLSRTFNRCIIPYEEARGIQSSRDVVRGFRGIERAGIFIGPEGGFEEEEILAAEAAGILPITLGKRILRTETAGLAILSVLMFELEAD